jgi:FkbM family methyltransferase
MSQPSFVRRAVRRAGQEMADLGLIGSGLLAHHAGRLLRRKELKVKVRNVGPVTVRPGDSDLATLRQVFHGEEYRVRIPEVEQALMDAYLAILAKSRTPAIVDAGANIGAASLWLRKQYPEAHIVAIEPDPMSFGLLRRNTAADHATTAIEAAIGSSPGHVKISTPGDSWATQTERSVEGTQIITMPDAFAKAPVGEPFIAKVDIEGFESDLFSGNLGWLDHVRAVFIEPHDWRFPGKHTSRSFQRAMGARDFELFIVGENLLYVRL